MQEVAPLAHPRTGPDERGGRIARRGQQLGLDACDPLRGQRGEAQTVDPSAQHPCASRRGPAAQHAHIERIHAAGARQLQQMCVFRRQQCRRFALQRGAAGQRGVRVRPTFAQQRQHAMAEKVAVECDVGIGGVVDPLQRMPARILEQRRAWDVEQWTPQPAATEATPVAHRAQPFHAGSAQRAQQEGFGLVVLMMGEHQRLAVAQRVLERMHARLARACFGTVAAQLDAHVHDRQRNAPDRADPLAVRGPGIGVLMQAMMHVHRAQSERPHIGRTGERVQEHARIEAAAEADQQRLADVLEDAFRQRAVGAHRPAARYAAS
jgi:hypothetical protein